jgi:hypothetical protein
MKLRPPKAITWENAKHAIRMLRIGIGMNFYTLEGILPARTVTKPRNNITREPV